MDEQLAELVGSIFPRSGGTVHVDASLAGLSAALRLQQGLMSCSVMEAQPAGMAAANSAMSTPLAAAGLRTSAELAGSGWLGVAPSAMRLHSIVPHSTYAAFGLRAQDVATLAAQDAVVLDAFANQTSLFNNEPMDITVLLVNSAGLPVAGDDPIGQVTHMHCAMCMGGARMFILLEHHGKVQIICKDHLCSTIAAMTT